MPPFSDARKTALNDVEQAIEDALALMQDRSDTFQQSAARVLERMRQQLEQIRAERGQ